MRKCPKCKKLKNIFKSFLRLDGHGFLQEEDVCNKCVGVPDNKSHLDKIIEYPQDDMPELDKYINKINKNIKTMSKKKKGKKNKKAKK